MGFLGIFIACVMIIVGSEYFLGHDNPVEKEAEEIMEVVVEKELKLTPGELNPEFTAFFNCEDNPAESQYKCIEDALGAAKAN